MISKTDKAELKKKLEESKASLEKELKGLRKPADMDGGEVDSFDGETDEAEEFSANMGMAESLKQRHEAVIEALGKMERGGYGVCEKCGMDIELDLLKVDPESKFCKMCKKAKA